MQDILTSALDVLALLLFAVGAVAGLWPLIDGFAFAAGGVVVAFGSWLAARR
jgi:hypothetical protein